MASNKWVQFTKERLPLASYALIVGGFVCTGKAITGGSWDWLSLLPFLGLMLFFVELRLMDELKDYQKDIVAHPQRPLPRGLISPESLQKLVNWGLLFMLIFGVSMCLVSNEAGVSYIFILFYLYFMYKEFFLGEGFANSPLLYAITHQLIVVLLAVFAAASFDSSAVYQPATYLAGFVIMGCFFTYEVCRKLDPQAHPILKTYVQVYNMKGVATILVALQILSLGAAFLLGQQVTIFGLIAGTSLLFICWFMFVADAKKFKLAELAGTLTLLISLYIIPLHQWLVRG